MSYDPVFCGQAGLLRDHLALKGRKSLLEFVIVSLAMATPMMLVLQIMAKRRIAGPALDQPLGAALTVVVVISIFAAPLLAELTSNFKLPEKAV